MEKPTIKKELAITYQDKDLRWICITATKDAVIELIEFGQLGKDSMHVAEDNYMLKVDPRFDFNEVLAYVRSLEK